MFFKKENVPIAVEPAKNFLGLENPIYFVVLAIVWLITATFTFKRQYDFWKRKQKILKIKKLQYEIRKNLRQEQVTLEQVRGALHSDILNPEHVEIPQLDELRSVLQDINEQLNNLEGVLEN